MKQPNAYRLGKTIWKKMIIEDFYLCLNFEKELREEHLIKMGAVPVESKQIEKLKSELFLKPFLKMNL